MVDLNHGTIKNDKGEDVFVMLDPFEEGHIYTDKEGKSYDCISITKAEELAGLTNWTDEMRELYKEHIERGKFVHREIEKSIAKGELTHEQEDIVAIWNFLQEKKEDGYEIVNEFGINGNYYGKNFVGTIDCILVKNNKAVICDWKTGTSNFNKTGTSKQPAIVQINSYARMFKDANPDYEIDKLIVFSSALGKGDIRPYKEGISDTLFKAISQNKTYSEISNLRANDCLSQGFKDATDKLEEVMTRKNEIEEQFKKDPEYKALEKEEKSIKDALKKEITSNPELETNFNYGKFKFSNTYKVSVDAEKLAMEDPLLFSKLAKETQSIVITQIKDKEL